MKVCQQSVILGLIPYKSTWTGGFKAVGKDAESALKVYQDALHMIMLVLLVLK